MAKLLVVLLLRLGLSISAIGVLGAGLSVLSGGARDRGPFDKPSLGITLVAWMMVETLVYFYDLLPGGVWVLFCCLELYLHTGMISRLLGRSMRSAAPLALTQAGMIAVVLLSIIYFLEQF